MSDRSASNVAHQTAAWLLALLVLAIQWRDGEWTVRGQLARWIHQQTRAAAYTEVSRRAE